MKWIPYSLGIAVLAPLLLTPIVIAAPRPVDRLTPAQLQQFSRDLIRSSSEDFFRRGREQLEREVELLAKRQTILTEGVLKISDQPVYPQSDPTEFKRPDERFDAIKQ